MVTRRKFRTKPTKAENVAKILTGVAKEILQHKSAVGKLGKRVGRVAWGIQRRGGATTELTNDLNDLARMLGEAYVTLERAENQTLTLRRKYRS